MQNIDILESKNFNIRTAYILKYSVSAYPQGVIAHKLKIESITVCILRKL